MSVRHRVCGGDVTGDEVYKVVFMVDGAVYDTVTVDGGNPVHLPADPEKAGYSFEGWYYGGDMQFKFDAGSTVTADITVHAKWSEYVQLFYTPGLALALISNGTAYAVSKGTATDAEVVIPAVYNGKPVTAIADQGFEYYTALTDITIPSSVTYIGFDAFYYCPNLTIYAAAASQPAGWDTNWNPDDRPVVWGAAV
ncbi:MAG: InlB B-repeat-containing protein [Firmicutes bacterium]|nr:InlB B-repeat-containing protein [Bacillota bacterium]